MQEAVTNFEAFTICEKPVGLLVNRDCGYHVCHTSINATKLVAYRPNDHMGWYSKTILNRPMNSNLTNMVEY